MLLASAPYSNYPWLKPTMFFCVQDKFKLTWALRLWENHLRFPLNHLVLWHLCWKKINNKYIFCVPKSDFYINVVSWFLLMKIILKLASKYNHFKYFLVYFNKQTGVLTPFAGQNNLFWAFTYFFYKKVIILFFAYSSISPREGCQPAHLVTLLPGSVSLGFHLPGSTMT